MPLTTGTRLGAYEIVAAIGAGGMGEVYRARDTRLGREVAIKTLPDLFTADLERVARFQREAQILAALNHPHIAGIHGLEEISGTRFLILELVDGESLADRIARGRLAVTEALAIARQVIDALEAAHEKGIVHRDLKPANIMIAADDCVKVLDFGLAKALDDGGGAASAKLSHSPTITTPAMMTGVGVVLGTAAYMSPEQAKGRPADKRTDVWAFGCVLYEMLTGRRAFEGDDVSDTIAAILRGEPDWSALPADAPPAARAIVKQCLLKERTRRIPDIAVVRYILDQSAGDSAASQQPAPRTRSPRVWQITTALLLLTTLAAAAAWYQSRSAQRTVMRFLVPPPDGAVFASGAANRLAAAAVVSPDGSRLAFTARDQAGKVLLWVRPIDSVAAQPLAGTEGAAYPFWSPDSRYLAFSLTGRLMRIAASGGAPQTICATATPTGVARGGAWSRDGVIVFNNGPGPLYRVTATGGSPSAIGTVPAGLTQFVFPALLPDDHHLLAYAIAGEGANGAYVVSRETGESTRLVAAESGAVYAPDRGGLIVFARQGTLMAQPFDARTRAVRGEAFTIAEHLDPGPVNGFVSFSVSAAGILAYGTGKTSDDLLQLAWIDRQGREVEPVGSQGPYRGIDLSPDGNRVAAHYHERFSQGDVWISDLTRGTTSRFTFDQAQENSSPIWSPDGGSIVFGSLRSGKWGLYRKAANNAGSEERLLEVDENLTVLPKSWSPDGKFIVYEQFSASAPRDIWLLPLSDERKPVPLITSPFAEALPQVSPDGKWLAYGSNETGRQEIYVQSFPRGTGRWQVSANGGAFPRWRADGRELFYMQQAGGKMVAVDVASGTASFEAGRPKELFDASIVTALAHEGGRTIRTSSDRTASDS